MVFAALDARGLDALVLVLCLAGGLVLTVLFVTDFRVDSLLVRAVVFLSAARVVLALVVVRGLVFDTVVFVERFDAVAAFAFAGARAVLLVRDFVTFVLF